VVRDVIFVFAGVGLLLIVFLAFSGGREGPGWFEQLRVRARRESAPTIRAGSGAERLVRESEEAKRIETAWEEERNRAGLQEAEPAKWPLRD